MPPTAIGHSNSESLEEIATHLEEEARMVLPGIQALFGFQLIAVFNQRFTEFSTIDQKIHLVALLCSAVSVLLILAPPAYHRIVEPSEISAFFCRFGSQCLSIAMLPLATGLSLDLYVISRAIVHSLPIAIALGAGMFSFFVFAWFLFPYWIKRRRRLDSVESGK